MWKVFFVKIQTFFQLSKSETNTVFLLLTLLFISMFIPILIEYIYPLKQTDYFAKEYDSLLQVLEEQQKKEREEIVYFTFNPNTITFEDWQKLGLSTSLARTIENYKAKGGTFYKKEDLLKIYGLSERTYQQLEAYVSIPPPKEKSYSHKKTYPQKKEPYNVDKYVNKSDSARNFVNKYPKYEKKQIIPFELNTATVDNLVQIKGIGKKRANSILSYREKVGKFYTYQQLLEIKFFPPELIDSLRKYANIDFSHPKKIHINHISYLQLGRHPYLDWDEAKLIINYREQHGAFQNEEAFRKAVQYMEKFKIEKILPYLDFSQQANL